MGRRRAVAIVALLLAPGGCLAPQPRFAPVMVEIHRAGALCRATADGKPVGYPFAGTGNGDLELIRSLQRFAKRRFLVLADDDVPYLCTDVVLAGIQRGGATGINYKTVERPGAPAKR